MRRGSAKATGREAQQIKTRTFPIAQGHPGSYKSVSAGGRDTAVLIWDVPRGARPLYSSAASFQGKGGRCRSKVPSAGTIRT